MAFPSCAGFLALDLEPSRTLVRISRYGCRSAKFASRTSVSRFRCERFRWYGSINFLLVLGLERASTYRTWERKKMNINIIKHFFYNKSTKIFKIQKIEKYFSLILPVFETLSLLLRGSFPRRLSVSRLLCLRLIVVGGFWCCCCWS